MALPWHGHWAALPPGAHGEAEPPGGHYLAEPSNEEDESNTIDYNPDYDYQQQRRVNFSCLT